MSSIDLPDGASYTFGYDSAGRIDSVTLPTGGTLSYTYNGIECADGSTSGITREVSGPGITSGTWTYARSGTIPTSSVTTITDPASNVTTVDFSGDYAGDYYETERTVKQGSSTTLAIVDTCYNGAAVPCVGTGSISLPIKQRTVQTTVYAPSATESETVISYDSYGNPTEVDEYGYGSGAVGSLARKTVTSYQTFGYGVTGVNFELPSEVQVYQGSTLEAQTQYTYSDTVTSTSGTPQHNSTVSGNRANLTGVTSATAISGGTVTASISGASTYYDTGMPNTSTDFNSNTTTYHYSNATATCGNALPSSVTLPISYTYNPAMTWNCNGAALASSTDFSNQTTSYGYGSDPYWRLVTATYPNGGWIENAYTGATTVNTYTGLNESLPSGTPSCPAVTSNPNCRQDEVVLDALGRPSTRSLVSDPAGGDTTTTTYDSNGRVEKVAYPGSASDTYSYDALNRVSSVTHADSNVAYTYYGANVSTNGGRSTQFCSVTGYPTLTKDEAGHSRQTWTDGLGRLVEVDEPDPANGSLTDSSAVDTCYTYDALNDLIGITQGSSQTRTYGHDARGRLTSAATPETGGCATTYGYDGNSNLTSRTAPKENQTSCSTTVTTTYAYDALNRLTQKSYSDGTPTASFYYDQTGTGLWGNPTLANPKGRLTSTAATTNPGGTLLAATVYSYDPMGRVQDSWQCTPYNCSSSTIWNLHYNYDLAGDVTSWTHPAGFTVTNQINSAQQITQISQSPYDNASYPQYLATSITYTSFGSISTLGNGCVPSGSCTQGQDSYDYNNRLQPVRIRLGTSINTAANYCLVYNYYAASNPTSCAVPAAGTGNNGSVMGYYYQDTTNPSLGHAATYGYDSLNRLTSAVATGSSTYNLTFAVGRYANMTCQTNSQTQGLCTNLTFNVTTNHITTSGYTYDAAGNLTADGTGTGSHTYQWDAEGRLLSMDSGGTENETYNALGQLAQFSTPTYVSNQPYDPAGQFLGQYNSSGGFWWEEDVRLGGRILAYNLGGVHTVFLHKDALGSSRQATGPGGGVLQDQLFYPWGQSWQSLGMWQEQGFAAFDYLHTSDNLYPTPFRNYASMQGRWLSPDPVGGNITNPQSLNRYAYVLNNPTTLTDPLGLCSPADPNCHQPCQIGSCREPGVWPPPAGSGGLCVGNGVLIGCGGVLGYATGDIFSLLFPTGCGESGCGATLDFNAADALDYMLSVTPQTGAANNGKPCTNGLGSGGAGIGGGYNLDLGAGIAGVSSTGGVGAGLFHNAGGGFSAGAFASGAATAYAGPHIVGAPTQASSTTFTLGAYAGIGPNVFVTNAASAQQLAGPFTTVSINVGIGVANFGAQLSFAGGIWELSVTPPMVSLGIGAAGSVVTTNTVATHTGCH